MPKIITIIYYDNQIINGEVLEKNEDTSEYVIKPDKPVMNEKEIRDKLLVDKSMIIQTQTT